MSVSTAIKGDLAVVAIDNPPVNAASQSVRAGLLAALAETEANDAVRAVVLCAKGRTFTAGADVREFGAPPVPPHLPDVVLALEGARKPWIAALHGAVLGGGLEIALGCGYRVAAAETTLGFPEVALGLIPGAGGTVRLPRLIDPIAALEMVAGGKPVSAERALETGLIDQIADGDLMGAATALARSAAPDVQALSQRAARPILDQSAWDAAAQNLTKRAKGATAPVAAIEAVRTAVDHSAEAALAHERKTFLALKEDPQSAALRHIFFAERSTTKGAAPATASPREIGQVGVVGGGTMGAGIAAACLMRDLPVTLVERDAGAADAAAARVKAVLDGALKRGLLTAERRAAQLDQFTAKAGYDALSASDLIIEAVFEDLAVKHEVFAALDAVAPPGAILASNTSYLDLDEIAAPTRDPSRVIGLHFFSPAHVMKLLEVALPGGASDSARATGLAFAKRLGKIAVPTGVGEGFIGNRIMSAYRRAAEEMVEDGALPWDVDRVMRAYGWPMGLFEMQDLAGLDISWAMRKRQAATRDPNQRYVALGDALCEAGRFGRKTGAGWYDYPDGGAATPSPWTEALLVKTAAEKGSVRQSFSDDKILTTILSALTAEAEAALAAGVARRAEDIDVVMVNGFGFPRWRGGPMYQAGLVG